MWGGICDPLYIPFAASDVSKLIFLFVCMLFICEHSYATCLKPQQVFSSPVGRTHRAATHVLNANQNRLESPSHVLFARFAPGVVWWEHTVTNNGYLRKGDE